MMTYLDERMQRSATADRCRDCHELVQRRTTATGQPVTLEAYRHPDGEYIITAGGLHAARTDGPFGYRRHTCQGE